MPLECAEVVSENLDSSEYHCDSDMQQRRDLTPQCNFECMPGTCRVEALKAAFLSNRARRLGA